MARGTSVRRPRHHDTISSDSEAITTIAISMMNRDVASGGTGTGMQVCRLLVANTIVAAVPA